MIEAIEIKNFQSHKNTSIEFSKGLNVISGTSDSGKSSIIRAIKWVVENRPSGDSIRNWDCKKTDKTKVSIKLSDNVLIEKERTDNKTKYLIDQKEFEAMRSDVPEEIRNAFNLSEFNIQNQHDPYFLLNNSSGEIAKKMNDLVGLDIIDTIFKNLNSKILVTKRTISELIESSKSLEIYLSQLSWLEKADKELVLIEKQEKQLEERKQDFSSIQTSIDKIVSLKTTIQKKEKFVVAGKQVEKLLSDCKGLEEGKAKWETISSQMKNYDTVLRKENSSSASLLSMRKELKTLIEKYKICPVCGGEINKHIIERILR